MGEEYEWLLTHPRFNPTSTRCLPENAPLASQIIEEWTKKHDCKDVLYTLKKHGVPCTKVKTIDELCDKDSHIKARGMLVKIHQPFIGDIEVFGSPLKFSMVSSHPRGHAPFIGEHNEEILIDLLGYSKEELSDLYKEGVLYAELRKERKKWGIF
jgi:crotonobetainyl-CoA:carnitine CoA-transferase CaiB-like acyl-CoA transferase